MPTKPNSQNVTMRGGVNVGPTTTKKPPPPPTKKPEPPAEPSAEDSVDHQPKE